MANGVVSRLVFAEIFSVAAMLTLLGCGARDRVGASAAVTPSDTAGDSGMAAPTAPNPPSEFTPVPTALSGPLVVSPPDIAITVDEINIGASVVFEALRGGVPVQATWSFDREEVAQINTTNGTLTPGAKVGGKGVVTARYGGVTATANVTVRLRRTENGGTATSARGAGGAGGVGGEGVGGPVSDDARKILGQPPVDDPSIKWLYPYDQTVWPRGLLAPLLQWEAAGHSIDAVAIHLEESTFIYDGYFAKGDVPLVHHPIPQSAWEGLTFSNEGDDAQVSLVFLINGRAVGPIRETWHIAKTTLTGTVYYNSYGTHLASNMVDVGVTLGGAILAIKAGADSPVLVAGKSGTSSDCRVCHSVSADGSTMIAQHGDNYSLTSAYDLKQGNTESPPAVGRDFTWAAISPQGKYLFADARSQGGQSALYELPSWQPVATSGFPQGLGGAMPVFSPDGKHIAFNLSGGAGSDSRTLATIDFDPATLTFSHYSKLYMPAIGAAVWPSFMPTSDSVVFQVESGQPRHLGETRALCDQSGRWSSGCADVGARGQLWLAETKTKRLFPLDRLNGVGYLPPHPTAAPGEEDDDSSLNYEPTVNPVAAGGYAWVVFTSRRRYGNVATINPFWSDPRYHDISKTPTTKKLWVAAINLNATAGSDPSNPAFYLPGQELMAGNARGYWVVDPCHADGTSCVTGDECCGGYCRPTTDAGGTVCTAKPPECAQAFEKCATTADCCAGKVPLVCINEHCTEAAPH